MWRGRVPGRTPMGATTRYLHVVCIYGAICLQILFLKHHILLFRHEILNFFASIWTQLRIESILNILVKKQHDLEKNIFGFVEISHRRYKLRRDVEQTPHGGVAWRWCTKPNQAEPPLSYICLDYC
jgi:hypothetical protein